jgi:hypothetical protein
LLFFSSVCAQPGPTHSTTFHKSKPTDLPLHHHHHDHHHHSIPEQIGRECEKAAKGIFPLSVVLIRKVKVLKKPKFDRKCCIDSSSPLVTPPYH